ncbi:DNA-directed RNA polymerase [Roseomonas sp. WA12]
MDALEGGYFTHRLPAVLSTGHRHTSGLPERPISQLDLDVSNTLGATPWSLNRGLLWTARTLFAAPEACALIPGDSFLTVPEKLGDDVWTGMDDAARKKHKAQLGKIHGENASRHGKRQAFLDALMTCDDMEEHPRFFFPWVMDFRGRRYPAACGGLSPQGNDLSKNLIHFADGKPLGPTGLYWLCVRAASSFGHDKLPLDARVAWAMDNVELFERIARNPLDWRLWSYCQETGEEIGEPWAFLATAIELAQAFQTSQTYRDEYLSHLPIPLDGTCNGLQHLSAMGLDPKGALETNLTSSPERRDIYVAVADHARRLVELAAAKGVPEALVWMGHVNRGAVKRGVLATPYGVSDEGIRRQLLQDGKVPHSDLVSPKDAAGFFRDCMVDALSGTVTAAKEIMAWLQTCAFKMGEAGVPFDWTTPTGSTIRQAYHVTASRQVRTLVGALRLVEEVPGSPLDAKKQALGAAPNVVHSFDASHLASTVSACARHYGMKDFAMIHDSYGTHAADTTTMSAVLRSTFVKMYSVNQLERLAEGFALAAPHVDLPPPPARGSFDITEVTKAPFFFS